jgi:hypothetical protein
MKPPSWLLIVSVIVGCTALFLLAFKPEHVATALVAALGSWGYTLMQRAKQREKEAEKPRPYVKPDVQRSPYRKPLEPQGGPPPSE